MSVTGESIRYEGIRYEGIRYERRSEVTHYTRQRVQGRIGTPLTASQPGPRRDIHLLWWWQVLTPRSQQKQSRASARSQIPGCQDPRWTGSDAFGWDLGQQPCMGGWPRRARDTGHGTRDTATKPECESMTLLC